MLQFTRIIKDARTLKALIGMGRGEFDELLSTFGGMKRYGAMHQVLRNKLGEFDDRVVAEAEHLLVDGLALGGAEASEFGDHLRWRGLGVTVR